MNVPDAVPPAPKSLVLAFALWLFLGGLGMHRFYLRRRFAWTILALTLAGIAFTLAGVGLLLLGVVGVWLLVDLLFIAKWVGDHNARGSLHSPRWGFPLTPRSPRAPPLFRARRPLRR